VEQLMFVAATSGRLRHTGSKREPYLSVIFAQTELGITAA
jgi:hypothetical protein